QLELSNLHQELGLTFVMVTHDQEEAMSLSDRIAVMHEGRIEQIGSPEEIYECPQTAFVADFIGDTNLFAGTVESIDRSTITVRTSANLKIVVQQSDMWSGVIGDSVVVSVRPEKVYLNLYQPEVSVNCFEGRLKNTMYMGTHVHYVVELASGDKITVRQPNTGGSFPDPHTPIYA
ncbi:ABC transporter ATP-binding protein, partial [Microcoleus sp. HI-ES]|nr:ABC transporter ATP-binding protein [Microcoleus sp. HI-ES]